MTVKESCRTIYNNTYTQETVRLADAGENAARIETIAQKEAIKRATIETMRAFPTASSAEIWRAVYEVHIHRKSGIDDADTISRVVSADQSWKKSSGHAFEEMIKFLATEALAGTSIEVVLQRDLSTMIKENLISNEPRDISCLKEQLKSSVFDLYTCVTKDNGKKYCFGCIQSKTSIRDRVTRDREPSLKAMASYFWSIAIVLDGDFLRLPKFISMVNGNSPEYPENGWHGMYVFSDQYANDRIYGTDLSFKNFKKHAIQAAEIWQTQRQWFDHNWKAN